jgi:hypothetical protein
MREGIDELKHNLYMISVERDQLLKDLYQLDITQERTETLIEKFNKITLSLTRTQKTIEDLVDKLFRIEDGVTNLTTSLLEEREIKGRVPLQQLRSAISQLSTLENKLGPITDNLLTVEEKADGIIEKVGYESAGLIEAHDKLTTGINRLTTREEEISSYLDKLANEIECKLKRSARNLAVQYLPSVFRSAGITIELIYQYVKVIKENKVLVTIPIMCPCRFQKKQSVIVCDARDHVSKQIISYFTKKILKKFKIYFPEYKNIPVLGAIACLTIRSETLKFADRHGLYLMSPLGRGMKLIIPKSIKVW